MTDEKTGTKEPKHEEKQMTITGPQLMQLAQQERRKLEQINARISSLQNARNELQGAKEALRELSESEKGNKIMVNLGAGIYIEASVEDNSKSMAAIAGNVFKEKKNEELAKALGQKIQNADKKLAGAGQEQQAATARVSQLESIMQAGAAYMQKQK